MEAERPPRRDHFPACKEPLNRPTTLKYPQIGVCRRICAFARSEADSVFCELSVFYRVFRAPANPGINGGEGGIARGRGRPLVLRFAPDRRVRAAASKNRAAIFVEPSGFVPHTPHPQNKKGPEDRPVYILAERVDSIFSYGADRSRYQQISYVAPGGTLPSGTETTIYAPPCCLTHVILLPSAS